MNYIENNMTKNSIEIVYYHRKYIDIWRTKTLNIFTYHIAIRKLMLTYKKNYFKKIDFFPTILHN